MADAGEVNSAASDDSAASAISQITAVDLAEISAGAAGDLLQITPIEDILINILQPAVVVTDETQVASEVESEVEEEVVEIVFDETPSGMLEDEDDTTLDTY